MYAVCLYLDALIGGEHIHPTVDFNGDSLHRQQDVTVIGADAEYALTLAALAFPHLKEGLVALLSGQAPPDGGLMVPLLGGIPCRADPAGRGAGAAQRGKRTQAPQRQPALATLAPGVLWVFAPGLLLLALPQLLAASSDRYFGYVMLARAMPDIMIWLGLCAGLGALNGALRPVVLARQRGQTHVAMDDWSS